MPQPQEIIETLLSHAQKNGADQADVMIGTSDMLSLSYRLGKRESIERSENYEVGIRVFIDKKQALVSGNDINIDSLKSLTDQAIAMAKAVPDDPHCGLLDNDIYRASIDATSLDLYDSTEVSVDDLLAHAAEAEQEALSIDGITNSDGINASATQSETYYAATNGFSGQVQSSYHSLSASMIAGENDSMQRDYDYTTTRHLNKRKSAAEVGKTAALRAVKRLNPRKIETQNVPVVYAPIVSRSIIQSLSSALLGSAIARGTSLLKDQMGEVICNDAITICDDPYLPQGLKSMAFDGEGVAPNKRNLVNNGVLQGWLLDLRSARQLNMQPTGNAHRSADGQPYPGSHNLYMQAGTISPKRLIKDIKQGFYITELMGSSVSLLTGDYSRGAAGFWIENGEIAYPVSEVTIGGNLKDMWMNMTPANDLTFTYGVNAPTLRIENMTVGGNSA